MDTEIVVAVVSGGFNVGATLIAAATAALIGKRFQDQAKLREALGAAMQDVEFLLEVESTHCDYNKSRADSSYKMKTREAVSQSSGLRWSGRFTPSRAKRIRQRLGMS